MKLLQRVVAGGLLLGSLGVAVADARNPWFNDFGPLIVVGALSAIAMRDRNEIGRAHV